MNHENEGPASCVIAWRHKSRTEPYLIDGRTLRLPLIRRELVTAQSVGALVETLRRLSPDGGDWQLMKRGVIRCDSPLYAPPPSSVPAHSPAGLAADAAIRKYPTMFGCESDPLARYRVYANWLFSGGNGLFWTKEGLLDGDWLERMPGESITASMERYLAESVPDEVALGNRRRHIDDELVDQLWPTPNLRLSRPSLDYCGLATMPANVHESYLTAALELFNYLLQRPVWENWTCEPHILTATGERPNFACLDNGDWRHIMLAEAAECRTLLLLCLGKIALGDLASRYSRSGVRIDHGRCRADYRLPPYAVQLKNLVDWAR